MFRISSTSEICICFEKWERVGGEHWLPPEFWEKIRRKKKSKNRGTITKKPYERWHLF